MSDRRRHTGRWHGRRGVIMVLSCAGIFGASCTLAPDSGTEPPTVPDFAAARVTNPTVIDNPYLPFTPGDMQTYESETDEGTERIVIRVLTDTRTVMGVTCVVVRDTATLDGIVIEDTHDWYAQDDDGNVWYMGEEVDNYNYDDQGTFINITHEGAWEAGKDVARVGALAKPGHVMKASPMPGDTYHQEYYVGEAEDMGEVIALDAAVMLSDGSSYTCLKTRDSSLLAPGADEYKYYAPEVGLVLEEAVDGGERVELVAGSEP